MIFSPSKSVKKSSTISKFARFLSICFSAQSKQISLFSSAMVLVVFKFKFGVKLVPVSYKHCGAMLRIANAFWVVAQS